MEIAKIMSTLPWQPFGATSPKSGRIPPLPLLAGSLDAEGHTLSPVDISPVPVVVVGDDVVAFVGAVVVAVDGPPVVASALPLPKGVVSAGGRALQPTR
ncbi:hypothetical protein [Nannocystis pusilla]|uniref:hypothetical protein n=1 Tax=Nannocystis pusilla TaxID=889268 RepID=UPI003B785D83